MKTEKKRKTDRQAEKWENEIICMNWNTKVTIKQLSDVSIAFGQKKKNL